MAQNKCGNCGKTVFNVRINALLRSPLIGTPELVPQKDGGYSIDAFCRGCGAAYHVAGQAGQQVRPLTCLKCTGALYEVQTDPAGGFGVLRCTTCGKKIKFKK